MSEKKDYDVEKNVGVEENETYSLNDDRRVKVLSPGAMVAKRFFRNRTAVVGMIILIIMFLFSFVGGMISPYGEKQFFYRYDTRLKEIAGAKRNTDFRYLTKDSTKFDAIAQAYAVLNINTNKSTFVAGNDKLTYNLVKEGTDFYSVWVDGEIVGAVAKDIVNLDGGTNFELAFNALKVYLHEESETPVTPETPETTPAEGEEATEIIDVGEAETNTFVLDGVTYEVSEDGGIATGGKEIGYISTYVVSPIGSNPDFSREFKEEIQYFLESNDEAGNFTRNGENEKVSFTYPDPTTGEETEYVVAYNAADSRWVIKSYKQEYVYDLYSAPSKTHPLGTDGYGMDMLTRLMYGGRVSLIIGFIVVILETSLGIIMGGISGYFGGWVDFLIMRIVDVMYCIPSTPILIIIGAAMDALGVDPTLRMLYLMLILGFLGWPGIAHMVRGQILSLREQEFMTATEATGLSVKRRIFKHLVPNVVPQLIVSATMGLGSAILTEATLSYLGLGVRFPFASWGNIINGVNDTYVLTTYLWVWIPAGICILLTVLAFNLVGDGLRDAFDPRMKR